MFKYMNWHHRVLNDKPGSDPTIPPANPPAPAPDLAALKAQNDDLLKRIAALEGKPSPTDPPAPADDLAAKAAKDREAKAAKDSEVKSLTDAITFNTKSAEWLKTNASLLPASIAAIFAQAEKEVYSSPVEKADAIKVGIVSEYFAVQSNLDLLTDAQKIVVDEFKKLTKTDKQAKVKELYSSLFEPAFEQSKRLARAEQIAKGGQIEGSDVQKNYAAKMTALSRKHYLKETK